MKRLSQWAPTDNSERFEENATPFNKFRQCWPKTSVVFVKVHKAGSSTVTNILQRFGRTRNLTFALPNKPQHASRYNYIGKSCEYLKRKNIRTLKSNKTYNILCNHVIYNRKSFREIFPADALYITILREPLSQFISTMNYYTNTEYIQKILYSSSNPLHTFLQNPEKFEPKRACNSFSNNRQLTDLGYMFDLKNRSAVNMYVNSLANDFHVTLIMERFDESLILLKRKACWTWKDILYIPQNTHWQTKRHNFTPEDLNSFKNWYYGDIKLYNTMFKRFTDAVQSESPDFFLELKQFKKTRLKVAFHCLKGVKDDVYFNATQWDDGFIVSWDDCKLLMTRELRFLDILMNDQDLL